MGYVVDAIVMILVMTLIEEREDFVAEGLLGSGIAALPSLRAAQPASRSFVALKFHK